MKNRDVMEVDVLFAGGGVAGLSGAVHLVNLVRKHNEAVERDGRGRRLDDITVAVLEKGAYPGAHNISGAVMDPVTLQELVPDFREKDAPLEAEVGSEEMCLLTGTGRVKAPITPPMLNNHGHYVVSLSKLTAWLSQLVEENGVDIFSGFAGTEVLYEGDRVVGVRTGDKGIDRDGGEKPSFSPGVDVLAKVTVFGDGSRGNLSQALVRKYGLDEGQNPQGYVVGVKEVWEVPGGGIAPGHVIHTVGYPHKTDVYGGGFIYGMAGNRVSIGLMTGLDYGDPGLDPHREFQKFKLHPYVAGLLQGGKIVQYGAKTAPVSGWFSVPKLYCDGALIAGDAANLFISQKIKGIHVAMKSGMLAAAAILEALLQDDYSGAALERYQRSLLADGVGRELYRSRNFHQAFAHGLTGGMVKAGFQYLLGGRILKGRLGSEPDFLQMKKLADRYGTGSPTSEQMGDIRYDGERTFDKVTDVYYSGTTHEEQQPVHLKIGDRRICSERCTKEYGNPCVRFCPAGVYEMEKDQETGQAHLKLNFSNCVHCKTCDIKDPYGNITWVPPEGGGGPKYNVV